MKRYFAEGGTECGEEFLGKLYGVEFVSYSRGLLLWWVEGMWEGRCWALDVVLDGDDEDADIGGLKRSQE